MNTRKLLVSVLTIIFMMLGFPTTAFADPISNPPPGSTRIQFFTVAVNDSYVTLANTELELGLMSCPFDVTTTVTGWIQFRDYFDKTGNFVLDTSTWHLIYTDTVNGKSVSDMFVRTKKLYADNITTNLDGTITLIQTWAGHASLVHGVGADVGRVTFSLTVDPNTGQEVDFHIVGHAGQITGLWSDITALQRECALLAP